MQTITIKQSYNVIPQLSFQELTASHHPNIPAAHQTKSKMSKRMFILNGYFLNVAQIYKNTGREHCSDEIDIIFHN